MWKCRIQPRESNNSQVRFMALQLVGTTGEHAGGACTSVRNGRWPSAVNPFLCGCWWRLWSSDSGFGEAKQHLTPVICSPLDMPEQTGVLWDTPLLGVGEGKAPCHWDWFAIGNKGLQQMALVWGGWEQHEQFCGKQRKS